MSSTEELREYALGWEERNRVRCDLTAIADRIDAEHEKALREAYINGCEVGMGVANAKDAQAEYLRGKNDGYADGWDAGFASADDWLAEHDDEMAEHGYCRASVADRLTIRFGDEVEWRYPGDSILHHGFVTGLEFKRIGDETLYQVTVNEDGYCWQLSAKDLRHYKPPTVEDVLREFAEGLGVTVADSYVAACAAKLRLAGDAE